MKAVTLRKIFAAAAGLLLTVSLAGCSHSAGDMYSGLEMKCGEMKTGTEVSTVKVTTDADSKVPVANFAPGIDAKDIQANVVTEGTGPRITGDQSIQIDLVQYNGETGDAAGSTHFDGTDALTQYVGADSFLCDTFGGVKEGSRVVVLLPSSPETPSSVYIFDIKKVFLPHAVGDSQVNLDNSLPAVFRDTNGAPALQFNDSEAPTSLKSVTLIKGWGEKVDASMNQSLNVHYSGWIWSSSTKFDSSWDNGQAVDFDLDHVIVGWKKGLDGVTVGSQVMLILPPALAYKDEQAGEIPPNSTLVFVVDVLGISKSDK